MQVAINPKLYVSAQMYAERQGLNLTKVIEDFLLKFTSSAQTVEQTKPHAISITPKVASLKTDHRWNISDADLDKMRYEYLMEKYQ